MRTPRQRDSGSTRTSSTTAAINTASIWPKPIPRHTGSSASDPAPTATTTSRGNGIGPIALVSTKAMARTDATASTPQNSCGGSHANGTNTSAASGGYVNGIPVAHEGRNGSVPYNGEPCSTASAPAR